MPHIVIEYAQGLEASLDFNALVRSVHEGALRSDLFEASAIKVRASAYQHYLVAGQVRAFIHLRAHILSGRSEVQKKHLSQCLLDALDSLGDVVASLTIEIVDMDRPSYTKRMQ